MYYINNNNNNNNNNNINQNNYSANSIDNYLINLKNSNIKSFFFNHLDDVNQSL